MRMSEKTSRRISLSNVGSSRLEVRRLPSAAAGPDAPMRLPACGIVGTRTDGLGKRADLDHAVSQIDCVS